MTRRQIKEVSVKKDNFMKILCLVLFQMSCLQTLTSRKIYLCFSHLLLVLFDLEIHGNKNFHKFVILLWQGDRIVPGFFRKQDSSFYPAA